MKILFPFIIVILLALIAFIGVEAVNGQSLFGIIIPYCSICIFIIGIIYRVVKWGCSPVPFRIPTTCGQQKSLSWIKSDKLENPSNGFEVIIRMLLEIFLFRSLFRNTQARLKGKQSLIYSTERWLWGAGLIFHLCFLVVLIRHFRLFIEPVPCVLGLITYIDGFLQIGLPVIYLSGIGLLGAVCFLLFRRIAFSQIRYISLPADYFPLFLIIAISISGILMRYFIKVDIISIKAFTIGLLNFTPVIINNIGSIFYIHLFLVSVLLAYFPFSKLMHSGGVFLSPTRNLANNNRMKRHINPWDYQVKTHTYEEYENDFREKMKQVGIPVEKSE